ncbi:MAG TPA: O-antigen ligase family protein [Bryobacteraceae bacterium]|nr:O-antigen ligase family protein [Bryobacteraceae bacterium]
MKSPLAALALLGLSVALAWAVFFKGAVWPADWYVSLTLIGISSCVFWSLRRRESRPSRLNVWLARLLAALPVYIALTLVPLPVRLLDALSPARAALLRSLQPVIPALHSAPLTVNPPATVLHLFSILGYIAAFLLVREIAFSFSASPWLPAVPLILIAAFEAALGMLQIFGQSGAAFATGTYTNRDHFAGLLEMVLPFAFLAGLEAYRKKVQRRLQAKAAVLACLLWSAAILLFLAVVYSLSRMGFIVALLVLLLASAFSIGAAARSSRFRWLLAAGFCLTVILGSVFLTPDQLAGRFAAVSASQDSSTEIRAVIWRDTLPLISEYKVFGCGLGGFESAFAKHQAVANGYTVEFAHNDYLQYLAELGILGFSLLAAITILFARDALRPLFSTSDQNRRLPLLACISALAGMALHSFVDFNTYIPANALALAWIAGIASANAPERVRRSRSTHDLQSCYRNAWKAPETLQHAPASSRDELQTLARAVSNRASR